MTLQKHVGAIVDITSPATGDTKMILRFPVVKSPEWFARKIILNLETRIVVLTDDNETYAAFKNLLLDYSGVTLSHFCDVRAFLPYLNFVNLDNLFLVADYYLRDDRRDGIQLVQDINLSASQVIVVADHDEKIRTRADALGVRVIPRFLIAGLSVAFSK